MRAWSATLQWSLLSCKEQPIVLSSSSTAFPSTEKGLLRPTRTWEGWKQWLFDSCHYAQCDSATGIRYKLGISLVEIHSKIFVLKCKTRYTFISSIKERSATANRTVTKQHSSIMVSGWLVTGAIKCSMSPARSRYASPGTIFSLSLAQIRARGLSKGAKEVSVCLTSRKQP